MLWVGHSKGGLTLYGHLARNPQAPMRAAVAMGSPFTFAVQPGLKLFIQRLEPLLRLKVIPTRRITGIALFGAPPGPLTRYMMLTSNIEPDVVRKALANVPADVPGGVPRQFAHWIKTDPFCTADGPDYRALAEVQQPLLLMAGTHDLLAPPLAVARAREALGGPVKLVVAGRRMASPRLRPWGPAVRPSRTGRDLSGGGEVPVRARDPVVRPGGRPVVHSPPACYPTGPALSLTSHPPSLRPRPAGPRGLRARPAPGHALVDSAMPASPAAPRWPAGRGTR